MQDWSGYIQVNGDGVSIFTAVDFKISNRLYAKIQSAVKRGIPLYKCDFYGELKKKLDDAFDLADYLGLKDEKPLREDFDDREEYLEALEEYNESINNVWDEYYLESEDVYDPGEEIRFKSQFLGKTFLDYEGMDSADFEWDTDGEKCVNYSLKVLFDGNGTITDIVDIQAMGLESESVKSSSYGDAYPDFDFIADMLLDELGEEGEEEDEEDFDDEFEEEDE